MEKALSGTWKGEYLDQALPTQLRGNNLNNLNLSEQNMAVSKPHSTEMFSFDFRKPHKEFTKDMPTVEQTSTKSRKCSSSSPHLQRLLWGEILSVGKAPAAPGSDMNWELNPAGQTDPLAHPPAAL